MGINDGLWDLLLYDVQSRFDVLKLKRTDTHSLHLLNGTHE
jgi:hypothetical protein